MEQQQQAYKVEGVDEAAPAMEPKKRKTAANDEGEEVRLRYIIWLASRGVL